MYITIEELKNVLDLHKKWLNDEPTGVRYSCPYGADLSGADLRSANLSGADLRSANLSGADLRSADLRSANLSGADLWSANLSGAYLSRANLSGAYLRSADLSGANLSGANLSGADLSGANLSGANLSGAKNLLEASAWMKDNFEFDAQGWIAYKAIGNTSYNPPDHWKFEPGQFLTEVANPDRCTMCACGVNFGTLKFIHENFTEDVVVWKCRISWIDSCGIVVPFNTDGKARCNKLELIEVMK